MRVWLLAIAIEWVAVSCAMNQVAELEPLTEERPRCGWIFDKRIPRYLPQDISLKLGMPERRRGIIGPDIRTCIKRCMIQEQEECLTIANTERLKIDVYICHVALPLCDDVQQLDDATLFAWQRSLEKAYVLLEQEYKCNSITTDVSYPLSMIYGYEKMMDIRLFLRALHACYWSNLERKIPRPVDLRRSDFPVQLFDQENNEQKIRLINQISGQEDRRVLKAIKHHIIMKNRIEQGWCPWLRLMDLADVDGVIFAYLSPLDAQLLYQMASTVVLDDEQPQ